MSIKRILKVTIEKEIHVELTDSMFCNMSHDEFIATFKSEMWDIKGIDDVVKYAAEMAAVYGAGMEHDAIGLIGKSHTTFPRVPDVKFDELSCDVDVEFLD